MMHPVGTKLFDNKERNEWLQSKALSKPYSDILVHHMLTRAYNQVQLKQKAIPTY